MTETEQLKVAIEVMAQQRNAAQNEIVSLSVRIAVLQAELASLKMPEPET